VGWARAHPLHGSLTRAPHERHDSNLYVETRAHRRLLSELRRFKVEQLLYLGTMLVHAPALPGRRIDETAPIQPKWAYPASKAAAQEVIRTEHGDIPYALLHLAGVSHAARGHAMESRCMRAGGHVVDANSPQRGRAG
jgi:nucleoside-diphosphate-sugar epimerase